MIKQEEISRFDVRQPLTTHVRIRHADSFDSNQDVIAHVEQESSVEDATAYLKQKRAAMVHSLMKRDPSPVHVPQAVRGEVIDLT